MPNIRLKQRESNVCLMLSTSKLPLRFPLQRTPASNSGTARKQKTIQGGADFYGIAQEDENE